MAVKWQVKSTKTLNIVAMIPYNSEIYEYRINHDQDHGSIKKLKNDEVTFTATW